MPITCCSDAELLVYYGRGALDVLARHQRVVLQPGYHEEAQLAELAGTGTAALAYLSLSEDAGPVAPWHRPERNPSWGSHYVDVADPAWSDCVLGRAEEALGRGFGGLFLDTLDAPRWYPHDREPLVELVRRLRALAGERYLLANRGFDLASELAELVDGFLFEAFSTTWEDGYRALAPRDLLANVRLLQELQVTRREVFALDYADTPALAAFARSRARTHDLPSQVSDRDLICLR